MENQVEIWKSHPDIAGIEVSTLGRVRTLDKMVSNRKGMYFKKGRVLKQNDNGNGYLKVNISINGKCATKRVHRLVAQTFIANPDNLPQVNHRDCNIKNNHVENLEWCDSSYNMQYREKYGEASGHPVFAVNLATLEVSRFHSQSEAGRALGLKQGSVSAVIIGKAKQAGGYWFTNDDDNAADAIKQKLHDIEKTGLKIK